jgi:hypothetical protein
MVNVIGEALAGAGRAPGPGAKVQPEDCELFVTEVPGCPPADALDPPLPGWSAPPIADRPPPPGR